MLSKITKTPMMDIRIRVIGIAKRERKVKVHNLDVEANIPYNDVSLEGYKEQAQSIASDKFRTIEKLEVYLSPWTRIDEEGYEHSMKEVSFGDKRYKKLVVV